MNSQATWADLGKWFASSSLQFSQVEEECQRVWCDDGSTGTVSGDLWCLLSSKRAIIYGLAHPGIHAMWWMSSKIVWPGQAVDYREWCRQFTSCNRAKVTKQETAVVEKMVIPEKHFSHLHMNLVGSLPVMREGSTYLLPMVNRSTRWPEVVCPKSMAADMVLDASISKWVAKLGAPACITSDRGNPFTSSTWRTWCKQ